MPNSAPKVEGPRHVPDLRAHLQHMWKTQFRYALETVGKDTTTDTWISERTLTRTAAEWELSALADATMWWVTADMCDLLAAAETQLPDTTLLEPELVPHPSGLVIFEKPLRSIDADTGESVVLVHGLLWGLITLPPWPGYIEDPRGADALAVSSYRKLVFDGSDDGAQANIAFKSGALVPEGDGTDWSRVRGDMWAPLGRSDWLFNTNVVHQHSPMSDDALASMAEDRRRVATMWLLQSQQGKHQITETEISEGTRAERRRAEREGSPVPTVRIINIKRHTTRPRPIPQDGDGKRHMKVRTLVTPHWRQQPYGPNREYRRPTWIHAFWRGPEDAPVSKTSKVRVWK